MNISMAVQTRTAKEPVFARCRWPGKRVRIGIRLRSMTFHIVTVLTKMGHPPCQKLAMVTSVNFVAAQAILWNRHVLKGKGPSLFSMAFVTEVVNRIGLYHCLDVKGTHRIVATGARERLSTDKLLLKRVV